MLSSALTAISTQSTSVALVTLGDDDRDCMPDLVWVKTDESGSRCASLQIANISWYEAKGDKLD